MPHTSPTTRSARVRALDLRLALILGLAASAAGLCGEISVAHAAAGSEPWCLMHDEGDLHCNYATSQDCLQAVASGDRGFCNENSSAASTPSAAPGQPQRRKQRS